MARPSSPDPPQASEARPEVRWGRPRAARLTLSLPGAWGALVFLVVSLTPSLLPRPAVLQGLVTGISAAIGYGLGVLAAAVTRALQERKARTPGRWSWWILLAVAAVSVPIAVRFAGHWQARLRAIMGAEPEPRWQLVLVLLVGGATFAVLLGLARLLRRATEWVAARMTRFVGLRAARAAGLLVVGTLTFLTVTGVLVDGFVAAADRIFAGQDTGTHDDASPPASETRSGSPASLITWESLGRQGRGFTGRGPDVENLADFHGGDNVREPIRIYAGLDGAEEAEERAELAVADLVRAGGFERDYLLVATATGTGWLDPGSMAAFEYLAAGDSAIVSMQYSFLPSWISYLVDQPRARESGRALFDAVYQRWSAIPPDERPQLYVFGESLGAYGAEAAFSGEADLENRTDGALFIGPPQFNTLHTEFTDGRNESSPEVEPVYREGRTVRFANDIATGAPPRDEPWSGTRVLYLQHPSDPVVWWSMDLLHNRPDWLREPRGDDVLDQVRWFPLVTFWQITIDIPLAADMPDGHGHRYTEPAIEAWVTVLDPPGWADEDTERLRRRLLD